METIETLLIKHQSLLEVFCGLYNIKLVSIQITTENGFEELLYHFSDNLGGYTLNGIRGSIREKVLENQTL